MMKWTTKFSTVLGCALAAVFFIYIHNGSRRCAADLFPERNDNRPQQPTPMLQRTETLMQLQRTETLMQPQRITQQGQLPQEPLTSATVTSSSVNIRSEASTSASLAGKATSGQELTVTGETQGSDGKTWYAVTFDNVSGYIRSDLVEAHVSEATAEPAVDESQETEEPEEEPIVDNSADYSVAFEDDGSGSSAWYLHDNTMGTRYQVSDLLNAEETNKNNQATIDQTAKSMRFVVILMAFCNRSSDYRCNNPDHQSQKHV